MHSVAHIVRRSRLAHLLLVTLVVCSGQAANARANHPFHSTLMEMEWNPQSGKFEVALSMWPVDVEDMLKRDRDLVEVVGGLIDLDDETQHDAIDPVLRRYIQRQLRLGFSSTGGAGPSDQESETDEPNENRDLGENSRLLWLGFEVERDSLWCYFEWQPPIALPEVSVVSDRRGEGPANNDEATDDSSANEANPDSNRREEVDPLGLKLRLENRLFHELHPDQENSALLKVSGRRYALRCTVENPRAELPWPGR
ncbi:MAG: DUF6702 family protein [Pirellulaceae bacterium]